MHFDSMIINLLIGVGAFLVAVLAWKRAPAASTVIELHASLNWLLEQNRNQSTVISNHVERINLLEREVNRLRNELADANVLIRSLQMRL